MAKDLRLLMKIKNNLILQAAEELWGKGISQSKIAKKAGVNIQSLGDYLNFKRSPITTHSKRFKRQLSLINGPFFWTPTAVKICKALNKTCEEIFPEHLREARRSSFQLEIESEKIFAELNRPNLNLDEHVELIELKEQINEALVNLTPREKKIIEMRFGLNDEEEATLERIGSAFNLTRVRIGVIEARALSKLRHSKCQRRGRKAFALREFI